MKKRRENVAAMSISLLMIFGGVVLCCLSVCAVVWGGWSESGGRWEKVPFEMKEENNRVSCSELTKH